jgi:hypothetical protein
MRLIPSCFQILFVIKRVVSEPRNNTGMNNALTHYVSRFYALVKKTWLHFASFCLLILLSMKKFGQKNKSEIGKHKLFSDDNPTWFIIESVQKISQKTSLFTLSIYS